MNIVVDNEICITKEQWIYLNTNYSKDSIIELIAKTIIEEKLPMPMRKITLDEAREDFEKLKQLKWSSLLKTGTWFSRYEYDPKWFFTPTYIGSSTVGSKAADYFQQEQRWHCDSINSPSPYRTWHDIKFLRTLLPALWSMKFTEVNNDVLRSCISLRKYIAAQFRPSAAKALYQLFLAKNVIDFSSGWGDRLTGFLASDAKHYIGVDPNENLADGYMSLMTAFSDMTKTVELFGKGAEEMAYAKESVDFVFTSPPYFNIEQYTKEPNQSFKRYKKLPDWLDQFLFPSLSKAWYALEKNGSMAINISDVYSNHQVHKICDPMNAFISSLEGAEYKGAVGYEMRKRPNSGALKGKTGIFAEPIWVWQKT